MNPNQIFYLIISLLVLDFVLDRVLDYLNISFQKKQLPPELVGIYSAEQFEKSQEYQLANSKIEFVQSSFSFLLTMLMILAGGFAWLHHWLVQYFDNPIFLSIAYFGILTIVPDILGTPFSIYKTFVIEEKFGFNKTTSKTFILDKLKSLVLMAIIGGGLLYLLLWLIGTIGQDFWIYFWAIAAVLIFLINMFYTSLIMPLFNKLNPLEDGSLKSAIERYSQSVGFPLDNIFVLDGSKRSTKANAFFSGIGKKKKIVLYDTLIQNHTEEELVAVLAHEVGHYKKKHIVWGFCLSVLQIGLMLFLFSRILFSQPLSAALGVDTLAVHINMIAFGILFSPISHILGILMNVVSRKHEFEADQFAANTYNSISLQDALKKLSSNNLSNLTPHPAYVFFHYSHPPMLHRLRHLKLFEK